MKTWYAAPRKTVALVFGAATISLAFSLVLLCAIPLVSADTTGYVFPAANLTLANGGWGLATNAFSNNGVNAVGYTVNQTNYSGFNFGIPAGSTIDGITVLVESACSSGTGTNQIHVRVGNGSMWSGSNTTGDIGTTVTNVTLGGVTNLYDLTWNGSNINNLVLNVTSNATSTRTMNMDFVAVDITYSPPFLNYTTPAVNNSVGYAEEQLNFSVTFETKNTVSMNRMSFIWNATGASCTDGFQNVTNVTGTAVLHFFNVTMTVPVACVGKTIGWQFFANNTVGTQNITAVQTFVVIYRPPTVNSLNVSPRFVPNGTSTTISANVTDVDNVSTVIAMLLYPNGTAWQNLTLTGANPYTNTTSTLGALLGAYNVTIWANDSLGATNNSAATEQFAVMLAYNQEKSITIDGVFADWTTYNITEAGVDVTVATINNWTPAGASTPPSARQSPVMVFDRHLNATLLFGGYNLSGSCDLSGSAYCNGTFVYNVSTNSWRALGVSSPPTSRSTASMVFDPNLNGTLLFGGYNGSAGSCDRSGNGYCNGSYVYNSSTNSWRSLNAVTPPTARSQASMVFDPNLNATLLFGGVIASGSCDTSGGIACNGTYLYNASTNTWRSVGAGTPPTARYAAGMTFDPLLNATVLFGGSATAGSCDNSGSTYCNGTYVYNTSTNSWRALNPTTPPAGRAYVSLAFDSLLNATIVFGGSSNEGSCDGSGASTCNGTHLYNATSNSWRTFGVGNALTRRDSYALIFNPQVNATMMFGGGSPVACDGTGTTLCNGTHFYQSRDSTPMQTVDLLAVSVANNASHLFAFARVNATFTATSQTRFYRVYLSNGTGGTNLTPEGNALPFNYSIRAQVNGSACVVYDTTNTSIGSCSYTNDSDEIELAISFSALGWVKGDVKNTTFETASTARRYDVAPDYFSFTQYSVLVADTCTPPALNNDWSVSAADFCVKTGQNIDLGNGTLMVGGVGLLKLVRTNITTKRFVVNGSGNGSTKISLEQGASIVRTG